jgi:hypothetical protein
MFFQPLASFSAGADGGDAGAAMLTGVIGSLAPT